MTGWNQSPGGHGQVKGPMPTLQKRVSGSSVTGTLIPSTDTPHLHTPGIILGPGGGELGLTLGSAGLSRGEMMSRVWQGVPRRVGCVAGKDGEGHGLLTSSARASVLGVPVSPAPRLLSALALCVLITSGCLKWAEII